MRKRNINRANQRKVKKAIKNFGPIILFAAPVDSLNLATLSAQLTDYYQEHMEGIHAEAEMGLFNDSRFSLNRQFTVLPGIEDELVLDSVTVDDFIHQHVPTAAETFNPTLDVLIPDARILKVRDYEGDLQFADKVIQRSHLMWKGKMKMLAKSDSPDQTQTFIEYLFWDVIMTKGQRTLRKSIFQSVFDPTGSFSWTKILNGVEKKIDDAATATELTIVSITGESTTNIVSKVESVFDTLSEENQGADDLVCSLKSSLFKLWIRADRAALGRNWQYDSKANVVMDENSSCVIVPEPDFTDTKIAFWRKSNAFIGSHGGDLGTWESQRHNRETKFMLNGKADVQFQTINPGGKNNMAVGQ